MSQMKSNKPKRSKRAPPVPDSSDPEMNEEQPKRGRKRQAMEEGILAKAQKYMTSIPSQQLDPKFNEELNFELPKRKKPRKGKQKKSEESAAVTPSKRSKLDTTHDNEDDGEAKTLPAKKSKKNKKKNKKKSKQKQITTPDTNSDKEKRHVSECLEFLRRWESNRSEWKFEKLKQVWLLKNVLNSSQINDEDFQILLSYMGSVQGHARAVTLKEMSIFMAAYETKYLSSDTTKPTTKPAADLTLQYNRAREIVQMLSDE